MLMLNRFSRGRPGRLMRLLALAAALVGPAEVRAENEVERLEFLEARLDERRDRIVLWQDGWSAVYGAAAAFHGTRMLTNSDNDDQVANGVAMLRGLTALTLMRVRPHAGRHGADPLRAAGPPGSEARLAAGEATLAASAHRAARARTVRRHLANVGANLVFGGLILAFGDQDDALVSTLMGIAGGEAVLLSSPQGPVSDLLAYRTRFVSRGGSGLSWHLAPWRGGTGGGVAPNGLAIAVRF